MCFLKMIFSVLGILSLVHSWTIYNSKVVQMPVWVAIENSPKTVLLKYFQRYVAALKTRTLESNRGLKTPNTRNRLLSCAKFNFIRCIVVISLHWTYVPLKFFWQWPQLFLWLSQVPNFKEDRHTKFCIIFIMIIFISKSFDFYPEIYIDENIQIYIFNFVRY